MVEDLLAKLLYLTIFISQSLVYRRYSLNNCETQTHLERIFFSVSFIAMRVFDSRKENGIHFPLSMFSEHWASLAYLKSAMLPD